MILDLKRFGFTLKYSLTALLFLIVAVSLIVLCLLLLENYCRYSPFFISFVVIVTFVTIICVNVRPIVYWITYYNNALYVDLLLSNMLLYYYVFHNYQELQEEKQKHYVISARFKNTSPLNYLKEKWIWMTLNNIRPMFYHLFSFTLFTDLLAVTDDKQKGIVSHIFRLLKNEDFWGPEIWIAVLVSGTLLYPIKQLMEQPVKRFASKHMIYEKGAM